MKVYKYNYENEQYKIVGQRGHWTAFINIDGVAQKVHEPGNIEIRFKTIEETKRYIRYMSFCLKDNMSSLLELEKKLGCWIIEFDNDEMLEVKA